MLYNLMLYIIPNEHQHFYQINFPYIPIDMRFRYVINEQTIYREYII